MTNIIFDCTEYMLELIDKKMLPEDCRMYHNGYIIKFPNYEEINIYRVQHDLNAEYEEEPNSVIVEMQKYDVYTVFNSYTHMMQRDNTYLLELLNPNNRFHITLRDAVKRIIEFDQNSGFETWSITKYNKSQFFSTMLSVLSVGL